MKIFSYSRWNPVLEPHFPNGEIETDYYRQDSIEILTNCKTTTRYVKLGISEFHSP